MVAQGKSSKVVRSAFCTNDVEWYKHYETLTADTSKLFMSRPNGVPYPEQRGSIELVDGTDYEVVTSSGYTKQGGILTCRIVPTYGGNLDFLQPNTPLNNAASKLYYYIVHGNSRNISYDKSDLMRCIIAFDNVQMCIEEAKRAYRFAKYIQVSNRWSKQILRALGWDAEDVMENLVNFRTQINLAIQKFNQISIPAVFDIFKSHRELVSWVYRDRLDDKAQFIANVPEGYWIYNDPAATVDLFINGTLNGISVGSIDSLEHGKTVRGFTTLINYMLHTIYDSTDMGVMQGDIKRAFADSQLLTIDMLVDDEFVPVVYDEEFLIKLHNMEFIPRITTTSVTVDPAIEPNTEYNSAGVIRDTDNVNGNLVQMLVAADDAALSNEHYEDHVHMMDLGDHVANDTNEIIIAQTRKAIAEVDSDNYFIDSKPISAIYLSCLDCVTTSMLYYYDVDNVYTSSVPIRDYNITTLDGNEKFGGWLKLAELHDLPRINWYANLGNKLYVMPPLWEVNNVTVYSADVLKNMLNVMTESLFYNANLYNKA